MMGIMRLLHEAGPRGLLTQDMAKTFRQRERHRSATHIEVNTALYKLREYGRAQRSRYMEPSPYYHNTPCWRWRITSAGSAYYLAGGYQGQLAIAREERRQRDKARRELAVRRLEAIASSAGKASKLTPGCTRERDELIRELREAGMTLESIGDLFGITRERTRQVVKGILVSTRCRCGCWRERL